MFRSYGSGRNLLFGNIYTRKVYSYSHEDETVYICSTGLDCSAYKAPFPGLFDSSYEPAPPNAGYLAKLRQILAYNEVNSKKLNTAYVFFDKNREYSGSNYPIGDHKLEAEPGDRIVWRVKIKALDDIHVSARVGVPDKEDLGRRKVIFEEKKDVAAGDTFTLYREIDIVKDIPLILTTVAVTTKGNKGRYVAEDLAIKRLKGFSSN
jgi:hypothetical protein